MTVEHFMQMPYVRHSAAPGSNRACKHYGRVRVHNRRSLAIDNLDDRRNHGFDVEAAHAIRRVSADPPVDRQRVYWYVKVTRNVNHPARTRHDDDGTKALAVDVREQSEQTDLCTAALGRVRDEEYCRRIRHVAS